MEETNSIYEIPEIEKLKGFSNAYRTKIGNIDWDSILRAIVLNLQDL